MDVRQLYYEFSKRMEPGQAVYAVINMIANDLGDQYHNYLALASQVTDWSQANYVIDLMATGS